MSTLELVLLVIAAVMMFLHAIGVTAGRLQLHLGWLGAVIAVLAFVLG